LPQATRPLGTCIHLPLYFSSGNFQLEMPVAQHVLRIAQLASTKTKPGLLPVSPATIWRWVKEGRFPKPYKLAQQTTVWDAKEIDEFLAQQQGGRK